MKMTRIYHQSNKELPKAAPTTKTSHIRWLASFKHTSRIIKSTKMKTATMATTAPQMKARTASSRLKNKKSATKRRKNVKSMKKRNVNKRTKTKRTMTMKKMMMDP